MAEQPGCQQRLSELGIRDAEHPVWSDAFNPNARLQQVEEDLFAGRSVTGLLMAIVTMGVLLSLICVKFAM